ncbi:MAG: hypothetical protein JO257_07410 [Deltaproteobacteria bacterium]|nr:hypothetical protein [Deltaproteobacteria bacterium]
MRRLLLTVALAGCASPAASPDLPWLHGFNAVATTTTPSLVVAQRLAAITNTADDGGYGGVELTADLTGDGTRETVLASYQQGIVVLSADGHVISSAPAWDATGSRDDLLVLAVGDARASAPMIAVAVEQGGHRESATSLFLYGLRGRQLVLLFSGEVERHEGSTTTTGAVMLEPGALLYRAPQAEVARRWTFGIANSRYVEVR